MGKTILLLLKRSGLRHVWIVMALLLSLLLGGCDLPQVNAEERLFLNLSVDFLGAYSLPATPVDATRVGGLSGMTYDRQRDRFYVLSDDRSNYAPARFYTMKLNLTTDPTITIESVVVERVTPLKQRDGSVYPAGSLDPEGIALSPRQSVFISSEGVAREAIAPFIDEFDLATGQFKAQLPIPNRYLTEEVDGEVKGMQDNLGWESLTLNPGGFSPSNWLEPFRLFVATESSLIQDIPDADSADPFPRSRFLHYLIGDALPTLIAEHLYPIDAPPEGAFANGLTDLLTLDQSGHFLALERSITIDGFSARLFQIATGGATDISGIRTLKGDLTGIVPIRKRLILDLSTLSIPLDNLEGMTLGPQLPDGTQSLLLVSDNNFDDDQTTQFLLFRLNGYERL